MKRIAEPILATIALAALWNVAACLEPPVDDTASDRAATRSCAEATIPVLLYQPPLVYPEEAVAEGWQGEVRVAIYVDVDGSIPRVELASSSGYEVLDQSALGAAGMCLFEPGTYCGEPIRKVAIQTFTFALDASP